MNEQKGKERSVDEQLYAAGLILLPIGIILAYFITGWLVPRLPESAECVAWRYLGIYCPGCGGTRAVIALLHGQFLKSLWYHPIVMYVVVMYVCFMFSHTLEKLHFPLVKGMHFHIWMIYAMPVILAVNVVLKNVLMFRFGIFM